MTWWLELRGGKGVGEWGCADSRNIINSSCFLVNWKKIQKTKQKQKLTEAYRTTSKNYPQIIMCELEWVFLYSCLMPNLELSHLLHWLQGCALISARGQDPSLPHGSGTTDQSFLAPRPLPGTFIAGCSWLTSELKKRNGEPSGRLRKNHTRFHSLPPPIPNRQVRPCFKAHRELEQEQRLEIFSTFLSSLRKREQHENVHSLSPNCTLIFF